jgi:hypothetical protein
MFSLRTIPFGFISFVIKLALLIVIIPVVTHPLTSIVVIGGLMYLYVVSILTIDQMILGALILTVCNIIWLTMRLRS